MKFFVVLIAVAMISGAMATSDPEVASIVERMESTTYGKTLLDTIIL